MGHDGVSLFGTRAVTVARYRYRDAKIPKQWDESTVITAGVKRLCVVFA